MNAETAILSRLLGNAAFTDAGVSGTVGLPSGDEDWPLVWVRQTGQRVFDRTTAKPASGWQYESAVEVGCRVAEGMTALLDTLRAAAIDAVDMWPDPATVDGVEVSWAELLGGVETDVEFEERGLTSALAFRIVWRVAP